MNTNSHADKPIHRPLPTGHDDQASPFWIDPDYRDAFQTVAVNPKAVQRAVEAETRFEREQEDLRIWEHHRKFEEQHRSPEDYASWIRRHTRSGRPDLSLVPSMAGTPVSRQGISSDGVMRAEFQVTLTEAQAAVHDQRAQAEYARQRLVAATCEMCQEYPADDVSVVRDGTGEPVRRCAPCRSVETFLRSASASVPAGGTRLEVVSASLGIATSAALTTRPGSILGRLRHS